MKKKFDEMLNDLKEHGDPMKEEPMNEQEQKRIYNRTMAKVNAQQGNSTAPVRRRRVPRAVVVGGIIGLICAGTAVAVVANWNRSFSRYFNAEETQIKDEPSAIAVNQSSSINGLTVTAENVIGDGSGFYVALSVTGASDQSTSDAFEDMELEIVGADTYQCSDLVSEGTENGVASYVLSVQTSEPLQGKEVTLSLENYGKYNDQDKFETEVKGNWVVEWKLNYKDVSQAYQVNQPVTVYGGTANWATMKLSPYSVTVITENEKGYKEHASDGVEPNDDIEVRMKDGTVFNSAEVDDIDVYEDMHLKMLSFHQMIDVNEVESVTFAGVTYTVK